MLTQVRKKILQQDIKDYSELRLEDWWSSDIVSYIWSSNFGSNQRYSKQETKESFVHSNMHKGFFVPYYQVGDTTYNLIPCPSGSFIRGHETDRFNPPKEMKIEKSFLLGETEITQEVYQAVMGENPSEFHNPRAGTRKLMLNPKNPVERVSWYDALRFCNALSDIFGLERYYVLGDAVEMPSSSQYNVIDTYYPVEMNLDSKGFRLPTEWEWEYAAKAGTDFRYSGSNRITEVGWYLDNSKIDDEVTTHEVKGKDPNAWGFYDMTGNVSEWCENKYNPNNGEISAVRAVRGGSCKDQAQCSRVFKRDSDYPSCTTFKSLGFRVCRYI